MHLVFRALKEAGNNLYTEEVCYITSTYKSDTVSPRKRDVM